MRSTHLQASYAGMPEETILENEIPEEAKLSEDAFKMWAASRLLDVGRDEDYRISR
jgi:hypothetical protein